MGRKTALKPLIFLEMRKWCISDLNKINDLQMG
jgi:hypothetical protein